MPLRLEVFDCGDSQGNATVVTDASAMEEARLAAYEQGYTAGWDDAAAAEAEDQSRLRSDLARNLQALGFTFEEARGHVLRALEPLLVQMTTQLLPALAREALASVVAETLLPLAQAATETPVMLVLNPAARPAVEPLLADVTSLPITIVEEPTLSEGQVYLRLGDVETQVNLDRAIETIAAALRGFLDLSRQENSHG